MKGHPTSYKDPTYDRLDAVVTQKLGLPDGLLASIRLKGEKSNADQVSKAGARTVYQVTPSTRRLVLNKYGVDAYLSPENAAEAAGLILKEGLERNKGDAREAVAEYHAGTNRDARGPANRAYVARVTGKPSGTAFDRAKARMETDEGPSIAKVYEAYKAGKLSPQERAEFEKDVNEGAILLPRGAQIQRKPNATTLPAGVVQAYNNHSEMTDAERAQLDEDVASGLVALPKGQILKRPAPRTVGDQLGMGVRNIATGAGGLLDLAGTPLNANINAATGSNLSLTPGRDLANAGADLIGLAKPATQDEKLFQAIEEGGVQGLLTAGGGMTASGAKGVTGAVASELAAHPVIDVVSSGAAGAAQEDARQSGAGPLAQLAAGVAAGGATAAGAGAAARRVAPQIAERIGPKAVKAVEETPREVLLDDAGELTEDGQELATRHGIAPDDLRAAYDDFDGPEAKGAPIPANDDVGNLFASSKRQGGAVGASPVDPADALRAAGVEKAKVIEHDPALGPVLTGLEGDWPSARRALEALGDGDARGVLSNPALDGPVDVIFGNERGGLAHINAKHPGQLGDDFGEQFAKMGVKQAGPGRVILASDDRKAVVSLDYDGKRKRWLLTAYDLDGAGKSRPPEGTPGSPQSLRGQAAQSPDRPATANIARPAEDVTPTSAVGRVAEAESVGVPLSRGEATQDFATQADEQALRAASTPEGQSARDFKVRQQEAIQAAAQSFKESLGDATATAEERGSALKGALEAMRDQGKAGVTELYKSAREAAESLGAELGDNAKTVLNLDQAGIKARVREILLDDTVDDAVRTGLRQQAAKYGLIGENPRTFEDGTTSVTIKSPGAPDAGSRTITFDGAPEPLSVLNAEAFRKKLNGLYAKDTTGALSSLKGLIDDAVTDAVERAAKAFDKTPGNVGQQFKTARAAHQQQQRTFNSKDVVAKLLEVKRGTSETPAVPASKAVKTLLDGPIEDLRKAKAIILSSKDPAVKAGWEGVRAQAIADVFDKAWTMNANPGGGMIGQLSGAKLRSEIARVGAPKLKVLLGDESFNELMKLQRVVGNATIPIGGTVNSSGTAGALLRFFGKQASRLGPVMSAIPGVGAIRAVADVGANVVQGAKEAAKSKAVLEGVEKFTPEAAAAADAKAAQPAKAKIDPARFVSDYLAAARNERLIAPIVATATQEKADQ